MERNGEREEENMNVDKGVTNETTEQHEMMEEEKVVESIIEEEKLVTEEEPVIETVKATTREAQKVQKVKKGMATHFIAGLIGAVVGSASILGGVYVMEGNSNTSILSQNKQNTVTPGSVINVSENDLTGIVQQAKESVVGIKNYQNTSSMFDAKPKETGSGSGVIYKKVDGKALIVTNNHVVEGAKKLEVKLDDGTTLDAKLIGTDPWLDLAVIEIDGSKVKTVAKLGNSDSIMAGETVIAIGNPLGFLEGTVTKGIVSSKERLIPVDVDQNGESDWEAQVIQTDASINPGNSGGALLNGKGELIGINSSKIAQSSVEGIGFAIPMNVAKPVLDSLEKFGEVKRPFLGVALYPLNEISPNSRADKLKLSPDVKDGIVITGVEPNSPSQQGGLKEYDVIVALDGQPVTSVLELRKYLFEKKNIGETIKIDYYRNGQKQTTSVKLAETQKKS